ncbi:hypothetical protein MPD5_0311 [Melissococcus plutonius DAT561]|nr:hypothetical protein MPD5_0311 [Melissococcus plutonius DAT561]
MKILVLFFYWYNYQTLKQIQQRNFDRWLLNKQINAIDFY